ncbi:Post-GPI attachment to proteins factor 3 [Dictyocoela muelleri]|nr:Post-GPI attachment to proteins factor 3 [Dictyocoela muelleri]
MIFYFICEAFQKCICKCNKEELEVNLIDKILMCDLNRKQLIHCHNICTKLSRDKNYLNNGKYAYHPILEFNEFVSGMLSVMSILALLICFYHYKHKLHGGLLDKIRLCLGVITYLSSMVFHMRDTRFTTILDYGSALIYVNFNAIHKFINFMRLHKNSKFMPISKRIFIILYSLNITYIFRKWGNIDCDILKNMTILPVFAGYGCMIINRLESKCFFVYRSIILLTIGFIIERLNLPPYKFLVDSHAVWHLCIFVSEIFSFKCLVSEYHAITDNFKLKHEKIKIE